MWEAEGTHSQWCIEGCRIPEAGMQDVMQDCRGKDAGRDARCCREGYGMLVVAVRDAGWDAGCRIPDEG